MNLGVNLKSLYEVEHYRDGILIWSGASYNLVTTVGKNSLLDRTFKDGGSALAWYVGLVDDASFSAYSVNDTMSLHSGWIESTDYSDSTRQSYIPASASGGSMSNNASRALFNMNATATIRGAFLVSNSTKGGSTGTLYGEVDFALARDVLSGDVLSIKITLSD